MGLSPVDRYRAPYAPLVDAFGSFVQRELVPLARQSGLSDGDPVPLEVKRYVRARSAKCGFYAGEYPEQVGGQGMPFAAKVLMYEHSELSGCPLAPVAVCGPAGPTPLLLQGTELQRERYLRPLVEGTVNRCLAATEPDGGSDLMDLATRAVPDGDGWRIRGRKCFVSDAHEADLVIVIAALSTPDGPAVPAVFVLDAAAEGLVVERPHPGLGSDLLCDVVFDDVYADEESLIGGRDAIGSHLGWIAMSLARGRVVVAANCNGIAARALELGISYAGGRRSFGTVIGTHQHVQEHVVAGRLALESARLLTLAAAQDIDDGDDATEQSALAKLAASEGACRTVDGMVQVHGAAAWLRGHPLEYLYRHVRSMRIVEGTSEIQKVILAAAEGLT